MACYFLCLYKRCATALKIWSCTAAPDLYVVKKASLAFSHYNKETYRQICPLLFQYICNKISESIDSGNPCLSFRLNYSMYNLTEIGETKLIKSFLESVRKEWIVKQFSFGNVYMAFFIALSSKSEMLDFVFNTEGRESFYQDKDLKDLLYKVIAQIRWKQTADIDIYFQPRSRLRVQIEIQRRESI